MLIAASGMLLAAPEALLAAFACLCLSDVAAGALLASSPPLGSWAASGNLLDVCVELVW